jgi:hypothetical protein
MVIVSEAYRQPIACQNLSGALGADGAAKSSQSKHLYA